MLVEPAPQSKNLILHLFTSSRGVDDVIGCGLRHLLEHLSATGLNDTLDTRLEAEGAFLTAHTMRDAMDFEIQLPPGKLDLGLAALREVMASSGWSNATVKREVGIIKQEIALRDDPAQLGQAAWMAAYGPAGADPLGDPAVLDAATPAAMEDVRKAVFATSNITLVIEGPVQLNEGIAAGRKFLEKMPSVEADLHRGRFPLAKAGNVTVDAAGEARAVAVPGVDKPSCAATICAALAIASEVRDSFVTYTPSISNGLVIVGVTDSNSRLTSFLETIDASAADGLFERGHRLGVRWGMREIGTPESSAANRGLLMVQQATSKFETLQAQLAGVSQADFRKAVLAFRTRAAEVTGTR